MVYNTCTKLPCTQLPNHYLSITPPLYLVSNLIYPAYSSVSSGFWLIDDSVDLNVGAVLREGASGPVLERRVRRWVSECESEWVKGC